MQNIGDYAFKRTLSTVPVMVLWLVLLSLGTAWGVEQGQVRLSSIAEVEIKVVNDQGQEELKRIPANKVIPGDIVIYTNTFENISAKSAENLVLKNPVPEHMIYVEGSAFGEGLSISFSVDGGTSYDVPENLRIIGSDGKSHPAQAKDYTDIRWTLPAALPSGKSGKAGFRARLN